MSIDWRLIVLAVALWFILRYGVGPQQAEAKRNNIVAGDFDKWRAADAEKKAS